MLRGYGTQPTKRELNDFAHGNGIAFPFRVVKWSVSVAEWKQSLSERGLPVPEGPPPRNQRPDYAENVGAGLEGERRRAVDCWDDDRFDEEDEPKFDFNGDEAPTPGERVLYALGQLYRLSRRGELDVRPADFDIWDLAGIIGVRADIEFVSEDQHGSRWHFASEVLEVELKREFPWRLLTSWEWAAEANAS